VDCNNSVSFLFLYDKNIPFRAIVNKKQCETRVLFVAGEHVQESQDVSASEMTYIVRWSVKMTY